MNRLQTLHDITKQLKELLQSETDDREMLIEQMNELIDQHENELAKMSPPYSEEEKAIGWEVVQLNKHIEEAIHDLFSEVKKDMQNVQKQKKSKQSYMNPYESVNMNDGMFLDNKL